MVRFQVGNCCLVSSTHRTTIIRLTHIILGYIRLVWRHYATVEALPVITFRVLVRHARTPIGRTDDRMAPGPECEGDDIARKGVDAVGGEEVVLSTDIDRMYGDLALGCCRR